MARRSNSTPPGETETEGAVAVADEPTPAPSSPEAPPLALLEATPDENPRPSELAAALGDTPGEGASSSTSSGPTSAPEGSSYRRPDFKRWSANKRKKATRKELLERLGELEGIAETTPPSEPGAKGAPTGEAPELTPAQLDAMSVAALAATFRVVSGIGARMRGPHWALSAPEVEALASAWGPVVSPHLGALAEYVPVLGALAVTAEVVLPRVERDMELARLAGAEDGGAIAQHATE